MFSVHQEDLGSLEAVELSLDRFVVGAHVSVHDPFSFVHHWEQLIFVQPVNSIAGLTPNGSWSFKRNSLCKLGGWQQRLSLEKLETLEDLAAKAVINAVVDKIVPAVIQLFDKVNLHDCGHSFLSDKSAWLSYYFYFFVLSWEELF